MLQVSDVKGGTQTLVQTRQSSILEMCDQNVDVNVNDLPNLSKVKKKKNPFLILTNFLLGSCCTVSTDYW